MRKSTLDKNLLSVALGSYLAKERAGLVNSKSKDVATSIGIGESLYRMIESGSARVHPKYVLDFIRVFNASNIEFDSFAEIIFLIQYLDSYTESVQIFYAAVKNLRERETKYQKLLHPLEEIFKRSLSAQEPVVDPDLELMLNENIKAFLSNGETYDQAPIKAQEHKIIKIFHVLPTLYYDFVGSIIDNLLNLPMGFRKNDLWKWEAHNAPKFEWLYAVITNKDRIISKQNFEAYKYEYLWSDKFKEAHLVFVGAFDPDKLTKDFNRCFREVLEENGSPLVKTFDQKIKKLKIHTTTNYTAVEEILKKENEADTYEAGWVFVLNTPVEVGIKAKHSVDEFRDFISLNYIESQKLLNQIKGLITA